MTMSFTDAVRSCLNKYATFAGRARRSEYWFFGLFTTIVGTVAYLLVLVPKVGIVLYVVVALALLLPGIAVVVRRLHDLDRSGAWYWIALVPFVGALVLLVFLCTAGTPGPNRYGPAQA